jgi:hypothetical protein
VLCCVQARGDESSIMAAAYWLLITYFGFTVILYPWWLVVAKSVAYSERLRSASAVLVATSLALVVAKSLLAPADLYRYETNTSGTTLEYRVMATVFWAVLLLGSFIGVPVYVRRMRLLRAKSWTLLSFVVPYVLVMLLVAVVHEWGADVKWMSYSIPVLLVFFGVASAVDYCGGNKVKFDEAFIMVAGFVPFWLGSVLGKALLLIFNDLGPLGSLFIFGSWKLLIFLFEVLSTTVGKKASRYNDGSVFAFCVIYTGTSTASYLLYLSNFIFISLCRRHLCGIYFSNS